MISESPSYRGRLSFGSYGPFHGLCLSAMLFSQSSLGFAHSSHARADTTCVSCFFHETSLGAKSDIVPSPSIAFGVCSVFSRT